MRGAKCEFGFQSELLQVNRLRWLALAETESKHKKQNALNLRRQARQARSGFGFVGHQVMSNMFRLRRFHNLR